MPSEDGLGWFLEFELPRCSFLDKQFKTWVFREQGIVKTNHGFADASEIEIYRLAVIQIRNQLDRWLLWLDKAAEYEKKSKTSTKCPTCEGDGKAIFNSFGMTKCGTCGGTGKTAY